MLKCKIEPSQNSLNLKQTIVNQCISLRKVASLCFLEVFQISFHLHLICHYNVMVILISMAWSKTQKFSNLLINFNLSNLERCVCTNFNMERTMRNLCPFFVSFQLTHIFSSTVSEIHTVHFIFLSKKMLRSHRQTMYVEHRQDLKDF